MKKYILYTLTFGVLLSSCVSPKVYKDLESKYGVLKDENKQLAEENESLLNAKNTAENELSQLRDAYNLKASYEALEKNSSSAIAENVQKNKELLAQLEAKENALEAENARLEALKTELEARSNRVVELESMIAAKDAAMTELKNAISRALIDFEGKGLTVEQRDGKVYVSMENKLLFQSGSWAVGVEGKKAVKQLGSVLADNPDINVLIEGHTDNVPYSGNATLSGNWDLSTKRATAIVEILRENANINPESLTAAGRGEYAPIATNETAEGKAKNRRIEVILTPKLDEITKLLNKE